MVSQSEHVSIAPSTPTTGDDRGFREHASAPSVVYTGGYELAPRYHSFWGPVIAGSLAAISISVLSYALMFGCRVGVDLGTGSVSFGWGAAIWVCITAGVALLIGGYIGSFLARPMGMGWAYGLSVWALTVPLSLLLGAFVLTGIGLMHLMGGSTGGMNVGNLFSDIVMPVGASWTLFVVLIAGLVFGTLGGMCGGCSKDRHQIA